MNSRFFYVLLLGGLLACGAKTPEQFVADKPLYEQAIKLFNDESYDDAVRFFESLRNRFPQSPYAIEAEIKIADAHFEKRDFVAAENGYQNFRSLHPTNRHIPYVIFRTGLCQVEQIPGSVDRDQAHTERTVEIFADFVTRFPNAPEVSEARKHLEASKRMLAKRELYVADFYLNQDAYRAALLRLEALHANTDFTDLQGEATYKLGFAYYKLKEAQKAKTLLSEVVRNPNASKYHDRARKLLNKIETL